MLFWDVLTHAPGDIIFGAGVILVLVAINVFGAKESTGVNIVLAVVDFATQLLLVAVGFVLVFSPDVLIDNVELGVAPTWSHFLLAIPIGDARLHGHRDDLEHGRGGPGRDADDPDRDQPRAHRGVRHLLHAPRRGAVSALPVRPGAARRSRRVELGDVEAGEHYTLLGLPEEQGGFAGDPILGVVSATWTSARPGTSVEVYVGLLAATILFLATNAGMIGVSRLVYSMGIHRQMPDALRQLHPKYQTPWIGIIVFGGLAIVAMIPGQAAFLGSLYSFGALLSFTIAHVSVARLRATQPDVERPYRGPGNVTHPRLRRAAVRARRRDVHVRRVRGDHACSTPRSRSAGVGWLALGILIYVLLPAAPGPGPHHHAQGRHPAAGRRPRGRVRLGARRAQRRGGLRRARRGHRDQARRPRRHGIHVLVTIPVPYALGRRRADAGAERAADSIIEQARVHGGRRVTGHWEKVRAGQAGRRIIEEAEDMRASAIVIGAAAAHRGRVAVRQDARDGAGRAPVPRGHRVHARRQPAQRAARTAARCGRSSLMSAPCCCRS